MDLGVLKQFVETTLNNQAVTVIVKNPAQSGGDRPRAAGSPAKPYATVKFLNRRGLGFSVSEAQSVGDPVTQVSQVVSKQKIANCEIIFYSNDTLESLSAENLAETFETALGFDRSKNFQYDNDFAVLGVRPSQDITLSMGDLIERRQLIEFSINYVHELIEENVDYFDHVELESLNVEV